MIFAVLNKLKEAILSVLPVFAAVFLLHFAGVSIFRDIELTVFGISSVLVVIGMALFNIGAESSMQKMGELVGASVTKRRNIVLLIVVFFLFGAFITVAEPDLSVLAEQATADSASRLVLIISVGIGVGIFLVVGAIRILFQKSLKMWLLCFYALTFVICAMVDKAHIPLSLDSGGVTAGPITVPFILAIGVGIASSRASNQSEADSFGLVAFASIGPILVTLILSILMRDKPTVYDVSAITEGFIGDSVFKPFGVALVGPNGALAKVAISLLPILIFFVVYDLIFIKLSVRKLSGFVLGIVFVYFGLVIFLTGVEAGFLPIGQALGINVVNKDVSLLAIVGALLGLAAVFAEPAVHVLTNQIENVSQGTINKKTVLITLAIGNALAIAVSMLRVRFGFNVLYVIIPGYAIAFALAFVVPDIYSAIAFDAGGVVSGPMNSTFILPFAIGACFAINGPEKAASAIMTDAFGTIGLVALMPFLVIQILGLTGTIRVYSERKFARARTTYEHDDQIIHF